jgi:hypothetical protein
MAIVATALARRDATGTPIWLKILWRQGVPTLFALAFGAFLLSIVHTNLVAVRDATDMIPAHILTNERADREVLRVLITICLQAAPTSSDRLACLGPAAR